MWAKVTYEFIFYWELLEVFSLLTCVILVKRWEPNELITALMPVESDSTDKSFPACQISTKPTLLMRQYVLTLDDVCQAVRFQSPSPLASTQNHQWFKGQQPPLTLLFPAMQNAIITSLLILPYNPQNYCLSCIFLQICAFSESVTAVTFL